MQTSLELKIQRQHQQWPETLPGVGAGGTCSVKSTMPENGECRIWAEKDLGSFLVGILYLREE